MRSLRVVEDEVGIQASLQFGNRRILPDIYVLIAFLGQEAARFKTLESFVNDVQGSDGTKVIVTSEIAKVEVAFAAYERTSRKLDAEYEQILDEFWADDSVVELAEFHAQIAKNARKFIRESIARGVKILKPYDAIHLATAQWTDVHEFHTYDLEHYTHLADLVRFKICEPYLQVSQVRANAHMSMWGWHVGP